MFGCRRGVALGSVVWVGVVCNWFLYFSVLWVCRALRRPVVFRGGGGGVEGGGGGGGMPYMKYSFWFSLSTFCELASLLKGNSGLSSGLTPFGG